MICEKRNDVLVDWGEHRAAYWYRSRKIASRKAYDLSLKTVECFASPCVEETRLRPRSEAMLDDSMTSIEVNDAVIITTEKVLIIV